MMSLGYLRTLSTGLILLVYFVSPVTLFGQEDLKAKAIALEKSQDWDSALQVWLKLRESDRLDPAIHNGVQRCLKKVIQAKRYQDPEFLSKLQTLKPEQLYAFYGEVLQKIQTVYVDPDRVSPKELFRMGLAEYLYSLNDAQFIKRYAADLDRSKIQKLRMDLNDFFATKEPSSNREVVMFVMDIVRASRYAGLKNPSVIVNEFICGACNSLDEYSVWISGEEFNRETPSTGNSTVSGTVLEGGIAHIKITLFTPNTPQEFDETLKTLMGMGMGEGAIKAIVLDLRGNSGGSLDAAIKLAERFLSGGVIMSANSPIALFNKVYTAPVGPAAIDLPMVVLVDAETASAAEVLATAIHDRDRGKVVGVATFGKGTAQMLVKMTTAEEKEDGKIKPRGAMRITYARLFGPSGKPIAAGVTPDFIVNDKQRQLETAINEVRQLSPSMALPLMMR
jgi:hypothetical protein